jgi:phosphate butyryltransferase
VANDFARLHERARQHGPRALVVAGALSDSALAAADAAVRAGIVSAHLVGDADAIGRRISELGLAALYGAAVLDASDEDSARAAVALVRAASADVLLKGGVRTDQLLRAVLDRESGLRPAGAAGDFLLSDVLLYEDRFGLAPRLVGVTDGGINVQPDAQALRLIVRNGVRVLRALGVARPGIALLSASEAVSDALPSTGTARALQEAGARGELGPCRVEGPLALDVVLHAEAARAKGIRSEVAGCADLMVVPNIEAGNILGKAVKYYYGSLTAHVVLGARVPVLIPSRVESAQDKLASIALGVVMAAGDTA